MKHFSKSFFCVAAICLIAGNTPTFAQFKFKRSSGSRSSVSGNKSSSGGFSNSLSHSQKQSNGFRSSASGSLNRFSKSPATKSTTSRLKGFSGIPSRSGKSLSNIRNVGEGSSILSRNNSTQTTKGKVNSITTLPSRGNSLSKLLPRNGSTRLSGVDSRNVTNRFDKQFDKEKFRTVPFVHSSINGGLSKSLGSANGQKSWHSAVQHILSHNKHHWCHTRPTACHWWTQYCKPIAHCHHNEVITCDWNRVHCSTVLHVGAAPQEVQWYLGLKGLLLPGKGLGIEAVEPNSPAELVGLQPGMVMTVCNGIPLVDEASMQEAIRISGGVLQMTLLSADGSQVLEGTVRMTRVAAVAF